jgi:proton-dependent oligopeptide transporter, POT family
MSAASEPPKTSSAHATLESTETPVEAAEQSAPPAKGHPRGLYVLFFTEMWARFGYYGMRALLVLYMINYLQMQPASSSSVYKWYTSLVYLTPLVGGFVADRYLGLRPSVVIGGMLMAAGYFTLSVESLFFPALGLIIAGNGFFKPNISTMVGKMYRQEDVRRDGAFTIFYMGINLGAFLAPIVCAELRSRFGFKYGFAAAGVGMLVGLLVFLVGQRRVVADVAAAGNDLALARAPRGGAAEDSRDVARSEAAEQGAGGLAGVLASGFPLLLIVLAVAVPIYFGVLTLRGQSTLKDAIMPVAFGLISGVMGFTLLSIKGASRDRSSAIFVLFVFAVLFWMAFEQAGNALNIWADVNTDRHVDGWAYPAEYFQSVNAILIFMLAPLFAMLWTRLARNGHEPPTAAKMFFAMVFMTGSFGVMVWGAAVENKTVSAVRLDAMPPHVNLAQIDAGRMDFDPATHELRVHGVLPRFAQNEALAKTVSAAWTAEVERIEKAATSADKASVTVKVALPASFEAPLNPKEAEDAGLGWSVSDAEISLRKPLTAPVKTALVNAGAHPEWRSALRELSAKSEAARVGGIWLFLSYLLATLGELCLSPVGLSMVTKLAPTRFASLFMGVWMLASSVAQYIGGDIGQRWGMIAPTDYFTIFVWTSLVGVGALVLLIRPVRKLMHEVH